MRPRILPCLLLLAASLDAAAASELYATINRLRAGEPQCALAQPLPALKPQAALERAARDLARGGDLAQSLKQSGYRATRSHALNISGEGLAARAAQILARERYCRQLQDAGMAEVGVYLEARELWVVMAAPFAPAVAMS